MPVRFDLLAYDYRLSYPLDGEAPVPILISLKPRLPHHPETSLALTYALQCESYILMVTSV